MPPDDPLGRDGPHIDEFLTKLDEDETRSVVCPPLESALNLYFDDITTVGDVIMVSLCMLMSMLRK